jgi:hypothetical protein
MVLNGVKGHSQSTACALRSLNTQLHVPNGKLQRAHFWVSLTIVLTFACSMPQVPLSSEFRGSKNSGKATIYQYTAHAPANEIAVCVQPPNFGQDMWQRSRATHAGEAVPVRSWG